MAENPWTTAGRKKYSKAIDKASNYAQSNLKISDIFPNTLIGVSGTANVFATLGNLKAEYRGYLIAARLNAMYSPSVNVAQCTMSNTTDMTQEMAKWGANVFKPSNSASAWTGQNIITYLTSNFLA